jgi:tetratricopeptide (TPR) repeat protein
MVDFFNPDDLAHFLFDKWKDERIFSTRRGSSYFKALKLAKVIIDLVEKIEDPRIDKQEVLEKLIDEIDPDNELDEAINFVYTYINSKYRKATDVSDAVDEYYESLLMDRDMLISNINELKEKWTEYGLSEEERDKLIKEAEEKLEEVKRKIEEYERKRQEALKETRKRMVQIRRKPRPPPKPLPEVKREEAPISQPPPRKTLLDIVKELETKKPKPVEEKPIISKEEKKPELEAPRILTKKEIYEKAVNYAVEELAIEYSLRPEFLRDLITILDIPIPETLGIAEAEEFFKTFLNKVRNRLVRLIADHSKMIAPLSLIRGRYNLPYDSVRKPRGLMYDELKDWNRVKQIFYTSVDKLDVIPIDQDVTIVYPYTIETSYEIVCIVSTDDIIEACNHEVIVFKEEYVNGIYLSIGYVVPESKIIDEILDYYRRLAIGLG